MSASGESPICYFRASVKPREVALSIGRVRELYWVMHFYVQTEDTTATGAVGSEFCAAHELEFVEFLCLPQRLERSQIASHEPEHIEAYEVAVREGIATVMSVVIGEG